MSLNKSLLQAKSDLELEKYFVKENNFIPDAIQCAFDILKSRGREFSADEIEHIQQLINSYDEIKPIHKNYKKAAKLLYIYSALFALGFLLTPSASDGTKGIIISIVKIGFYFGISYLVSIGQNFIKYLLLIDLPFVLLFSISLFLAIFTQPVTFIIYLVQGILQLYATILLFKIPKEKSKIPQLG